MKSSNAESSFKLWAYNIIRLQYEVGGCGLDVYGLGRGSVTAVAKAVIKSPSFINWGLP
jgi:hypothetical protein